MTWAKANYWGCSLSLVPSGMAHPSRELLDLPADIEPSAEIPSEGPDSLQEDLAEAYGANLEQLLVLQGSTQADLLVFTSFLHAGERVLIESPAYGLFEGLAATRGAQVDRFQRRHEQDWALDIEAVRKAWQPGTRLVVLTTVQNPTGSVASEEQLRALGELCEERNALALCSEVYLDFLPRAGEPGGRAFAWQLHPRLLSVNSFTKVYGLGSLRLGWLCGAPEWLEEARRVREAIAPVLPALPCHLAREALRKKTLLLERARTRAAEGQAVLNSWLHRDFPGKAPEAGLVTALRVGGVQRTMDFAKFLRDDFDLGVVPGDFFGLPGHLRIGVGGEAEATGKALEALSRGREAWIAEQGQDA